MRKSFADLFQVAAKTYEKSNVDKNELVIVLTDTQKDPAIADAFYAAGVAHGVETVIVNMTTREKILMDPPRPVIEAMKAADVVFDAVTKPWIYAPANAEILDTGTRCLQILVPEEGMIARPPSDRVIERGRRVRELLTSGDEFRITSDLGTDITFRRGNRPAHAQDGVVRDPGEWDSIATAISAFAPLENEGTGTVMMQGTAFLPSEEHYITDEPIEITMESGRIVDIKRNHALAQRVSDWLAGWNDPSSYVVAHVGFGLDERATLRAGDPAGWESILGGVNLAFGSNTIPQLQGENPSSSHLDFVLMDVDVEIGGTKVLEKGAFNDASGML